MLHLLILRLIFHASSSDIETFFHASALSQVHEVTDRDLNIYDSIIALSNFQPSPKVDALSVNQL